MEVLDEALTRIQQSIAVSHLRSPCAMCICSPKPAYIHIIIAIRICMQQGGGSLVDVKSVVTIINAA